MHTNREDANNKTNCVQFIMILNEYEFEIGFYYNVYCFVNAETGLCNNITFIIAVSELQRNFYS